MARREKEAYNPHFDSHLGQNDDEDRYRNHNRKNSEEVLVQETARQLLLEKIAIFKLIHEKKCDDGKAISRDTRMECFKEIETLYKQSGHKASLDDWINKS